MARIRTVKPEFPHSESMGRVSRDARLTFIMLWTIADDSGRLRGNSRMLASLLFPYDDDAPHLIDAWLDELDRESRLVCHWCSPPALQLKRSSTDLPRLAATAAGVVGAGGVVLAVDEFLAVGGLDALVAELQPGQLDADEREHRGAHHRACSRADQQDRRG